jgi:hypothetical protein
MLRKVWEHTGVRSASVDFLARLSALTQGAANVYICSVARKTLKFVVFAVLVAWLSWPIVELFDNWDQPVHTGDDTQYSIIVLGLCVGAACVFSQRRHRLSVIKAACSLSDYLRLPLPVAPFVRFCNWFEHCLGPPPFPPFSFAILRT